MNAGIWRVKRVKNKNKTSNGNVVVAGGEDNLRIDFQFSFFSAVFRFQTGCFSVFGKVSIHFSLPFYYYF